MTVALYCLSLAYTEFCTFSNIFGSSARVNEEIGTILIYTFITDMLLANNDIEPHISI